MSGSATLERKGGEGTAGLALERKAAAPANMVLLGADEADGVVEAIVSVTGIYDNVRDRILPGAYTKTLKARKPKGVWSHDWKDWVSRTEEIKEFRPGDPVLLKKVADAGVKDWPSEAGALVVKTRFNMKSKRCREAFEAVRFFSETNECEWSIGYVVPPGQAVKARGGRDIKSLDLFEYGPVLWGAASESMTLSVKSLLGGSDHDPADDEMLPDGTFRIATKDDVPDALEAYAGAGHQREAKTHIVHRAVRLGVPYLLPDGWLGEYLTVKTANPQGEVEGKGEEDGEHGEDEPLTEQEQADLTEHADTALDDDDSPVDEVKALEVKYDTSPVGKPGGKPNWVDKVGGLPLYIRAIAHALIRDGRSTSSAIAIAVATVKRWSAGGEGVTAKTKAKAAKALAEWEAKKARSGTKADSTLVVEDASGPVDEYDPTVEVKVAVYDPTLDVAPAPQEPGDAETKMYGLPSLPGSYEARQEAVRSAVRVALRGADRHAGVADEARKPYPRWEWPDITVSATFDDHVVATRSNYEIEPGGEGAPRAESFEIDYTYDDQTMTVTLGEQRPVRLSVMAVTTGAGTKDLGDTLVPVDAFSFLPDHLEDVCDGVKAMQAVQPETKAGRVLSGANAARLRGAAENLVEVLRLAGIDLRVKPGREEIAAETTQQPPDSTAPSAQTAATGGATVGVKSLPEPVMLDADALQVTLSALRG